MMRRFWDWELLDPRVAGGWERLGCWGLQKRGSLELTNREWIGDEL